MDGTHAMRHQQAELRLHEARQLAYEYAKQIVLKAYELSQQQARVSSSASSRQNHINNHERATGLRAARSPAAQIGAADCELAAGQCQLDGPIRRRLFEEAAEQINGRFRLSSLDPATKQERPPSGDRHGVSNPALDSSGGGHWRRPSLTPASARDTSNGADLDHDPQQLQASAYIEQDYATISSDDQQQQQQQQRLTTAGTTNGHRNQQRPNNNHGGRRGRNFQQCLNWHLIVSCFSTCLPQPFGSRHASATSKTSASGGPTRV